MNHINVANNVVIQYSVLNMQDSGEWYHFPAFSTIFHIFEICHDNRQMNIFVDKRFCFVLSINRLCRCSPIIYMNIWSFQDVFT